MDKHSSLATRALSTLSWLFLVPHAAAQGLPIPPVLPKPGINAPESRQLPEEMRGELRPMIIKIVNYALTFVGLIGVITVIYAGFLYLTSFGSPDAPKKAKGAILYAIIGIILILLSWTIVNWIIVELPRDSNLSGEGGGDIGFP